MKQLYGNAIKRFFPGMQKECLSGHGVYFITEAMSRNGSYKCPICASKYAVEYARRNRAKKREWNNAYSSRKSGQRSLKTAAYRANHPDRKAAHQRVQTAIRNGSLVRALCVECGAQKTHAHHDDYAKPIDVIWLCHTHHMERHTWLTERAK